MYFSFILRFWQQRDEDVTQPMQWHIELEHLQTQKRYQFATADELIGFFEKCFRETEEKSKTKGDLYK